MPDPRALANFRNLDSYRAWKQEGLRRSGFTAIALIASLSACFFALLPTFLEPMARDARSFVFLMGGALALYLAIIGGSMVFAMLRLNAWKRAHPWSPPVPRRS
jgi:hypothetical protein